MARLMKQIGLILILVSQMAVGPAQAQLAPPPEPAPQTSLGGGPRKQLATIIFSGLAGAVLGLSTLSFYGRPQERLSNIAVGAALGIITGAIYATYKTAATPYSSYNTSALSFQPNASLAHSKVGVIPDQPVYGIDYQWEF